MGRHPNVVNGMATVKHLKARSTTRTCLLVGFGQGAFARYNAAPATSIDSPLWAEAVLDSLTEEVLKSSEFEGETLDRHQVRLLDQIGRAHV